MNSKKQEQIFLKTIVPEYERIFNFIYSRFDRNRELAQDVTQEVMELAWDRLHQLQKSDSPRAWLMQIAMNEVRKYFRAQSTIKRGAYQEEPYDPMDFENAEDPEIVEGDVLDVIIANEERELLMAALNRLKEQYRIILNLRLVQDLKFTQIAKIVQTDEAVARIYYGRGLKLLRKEYILMMGEGEKDNE